VRGVFGRRTVAEAVFLVAVPVIVLAAGQSPSVIIASAGLAYLLVILFEIALWRSRPEAAALAPAPAAEPPETVRVLSVEPEREPAALPAEPEPEPTPEPVAARELEHARVLRPAPEPEPQQEPEPQPEPAAQTVVAIGVGAGPRQWNLWDLERLSRERAGQDEVRDEERSFLLLYLRDFAGPDGLLPIDFDALVRDSFGDLVGAR
jgi:hypothetical protein